MKLFRSTPSPGRAKRGEAPTASIPARSDIGENTASELIEAPRGPGPRDPLDPHDFPDGGGGGGAQAFRRERKKSARKP